MEPTSWPFSIQFQIFPGKTLYWQYWEWKLGCFRFEFNTTSATWIVQHNIENVSSKIITMFFRFAEPNSGISNSEVEIFEYILLTTLYNFNMFLSILNKVLTYTIYRLSVLFLANNTRREINIQTYITHVAPETGRQRSNMRLLYTSLLLQLPLHRLIHARQFFVLQI